MSIRRGIVGCLLMMGLFWSTAAAAVADDDVARRVAALERQVQELQRELEQARNDDGGADLEELKRRIDVLAVELEELRTGQPAAAAAGETRYGMGPGASKVYTVDHGVSIGGYGEMVYQNLDSTLDDGSPNGNGDTLDFVRAIVYFGYKFNDKFLFNSEIEFEHASTGEDGEVSVEFAYLDYLWRDALNVRAGMLLLPMGFVNELHEPTVFLGALRPSTERRILPSTWRENGAGIFGEIGPFSYRTYVVNGLDASGFGASGLRGGRQKGSEAKAEDFAWTGRLDYSARPGLLAGVSAYVGDSGQDLADAMGSIDATTTILEGHLEWRRRGFELRVLGVRAEVDDVTRLNQALGLVGDESVGERQVGGYVQLGYDLLVRREGTSRLVPYVRWETLNTQDDVPAGFAADPATDTDILTVGLAYQPIRQLVFKVDYQDLSNEADTGFGQVNASLGYVF